MRRATPPFLVLIFTTFIAAVIVSSCASLKESQPLFTQKEYEKMLAGSLDADYIGTENCLKACHEHDQIAAYLKESVHGQQVESGTGMPLVNCETCHGPGSQAIAKVAENKKCDTSKFIPIKELPATARSLVCLKCHSSHSMANMQLWATSQHAVSEVSCTDCHKLHKSIHQKLEGNEVNNLCTVCHRDVAIQCSLFSRHPIKEGKMSCSSCHEPHGSMVENNLAAPDVKSLCGRCHAEKCGPFVYEHADLTDNCTNCHQPHGSPFSGMLRYQEPFLCLQCHTGHTEHYSDSYVPPEPGYKRGIFTRCTSCHSQIHGSDGWSELPMSGFIR